MSSSGNDILGAFLQRQLGKWSLAAGNYEALAVSSEKDFRLGSFPVKALHIPARIKSSGAKVDKASVAERACFLCCKSRPEEQDVLGDWADGRFEVLVNPYPICRRHFTIVSKLHEPQTSAPREMIEFARRYPGYTAFFNGARAGASAPDHLHFQAVETSLLPLMKIAEELMPLEGIAESVSAGLDFPFAFIAFAGEKALEGIFSVQGFDMERGCKDRDLVNIFVWTGTDGVIRGVIVPRKAHRPACYFAEGEARMLLSPGALDMAGLAVVPRPEDFARITAQDIDMMYRQTGITGNEYKEIYGNGRK